MGYGIVSWVETREKPELRMKNYQLEPGRKYSRIK